MKKIAGLVILMGVAAGWSAAQTPTTTTILSSLNPSSYGQSVTFTATVTSKIEFTAGRRDHYVHAGN